MRFFHLSDLHIGKIMYGYSMQEDLKYAFTQVYEAIDAYRPDAIVIAGDVYDKSIPSIDASKMLDELLYELSKRNVVVMIISGNHDSGHRISYGSTLFKKAQIHIAGVFSGEIECVKLQDEQGVVNFYLLPFIRPSDVRNAYENAESVDTYHKAVEQVIAHMQLNETERNILVAHQFMIGAMRHEEGSEYVSVGGLDQVSAYLFDDFDYVALGHIHSPQKVGRECVRYAGTPIAYSFSEMVDKKSITMVDIEEKGKPIITTIPLKSYRKMAEYKGTFAELMEMEASDNYAKVVITDHEFGGDVFGKLHTVFPYLMMVEFPSKIENYSGQEKTVEMITDKSPEELFADYYQMQSGDELSESDLQIVTDIFESLRKENS